VTLDKMQILLFLGSCDIGQIANPFIIRFYFRPQFGQTFMDCPTLMPCILKARGCPGVPNINFDRSACLLLSPKKLVALLSSSL
jgi:hypothetical protein